MGNMGLRHGRWAGAVVGVLLLAGCGGRTAPGVQPSPAALGEQELAGRQEQELAASASPGQEAPGTQAGQSPAGEAPARPPGEPGEPEDPEELVTEAPPPPDNGMSVDVAKPCVSPGEDQTITLHVPRRAGVTMIIGYADRETHGHMNHGVADDNGVYVWTVLLPPDVPPGTAGVGATSTGADWVETGGTGDGGQAFAKFEVRPPGGCPST